MRHPFKRGEKALSGTGDVVAALGQGWMPIPALGGGSNQRILDVYNRAQSASYGWMYQNSPAVRTVIDVIVRNIGQLELRLYKEVSPSERQPEPDHPAAMSLRYPNENVSSDKFVRECFKDFLIYDNDYTLLLPGNGNQISLVRLPAHMVVVMGHTLFQVENYRVWPMGAWTSNGSWGGGGTYTDFRPDQIMHWHGEHPLDPRIGLSMLDTIRDVVAEDAALQQATVELAQNGLIEPNWIFRPMDAPRWSTEARMAAEEDIANRMRSRNRKPLIPGDGMEVRSFGMSPRDAQMYEIRRWAIERVAALYGVPLGMVGLEPLVADARSEFLSDTLPPYCSDFAKMLNQRILVGLYNETDYCFSFNLDEKQMGDERIKTLVSATGRPVMLTDEARARLNLPPVDGGDELVTPLNVVVGEKPSPQVMPIQDPNAPAQDGSYRTDQPPPPQAPKALAKTAENGSYTPMEPLPQLHPRRAAEMERQRRAIDLFQGVVQDHFNRLTHSLNAKATTDWDRWNREFAFRINRELKRVVQAEGDIYVLRLAGSNFDMGQVQHYLEAMATGAATAINDTIRADIKANGVDAAMAQAPQHVASAGTSLGARSTVWAREEAARQAPGFRAAS